MSAENQQKEKDFQMQKGYQDCMQQPVNKAQKQGQRQSKSAFSQMLDDSVLIIYQVSAYGQV